MEIHQLRYFLAACETLNFTRAAQDRNISQPALTKAIHMLEAELGGALFDTQSRPIKLTAFGEQLRDRVAQVEDMLVDIKTMSSRFHNMEDSAFTLGIVNTIGNDRFIDITRRLQEQLLGISIKLLHTGQGHLLDALKAGEIELALITNHPTHPKVLSGFEVYEEPYMLAVDAAHTLANRESIQLTELQDQPFILRTHCEKSAKFHDVFRDVGLELNCNLQTDQDEFVRLMISIGYGVSIMPKSLITSPLVAVPIDNEHFVRTIRLVSREDRALSPIAMHVQNTLRSMRDLLPAL